MEDWSDAQEIVNGIPEELWSLPSEVMNDYLSAHPDIKEKVLEFLKINFPARYFVPNVGQEKAILPLKDMDINADEMKVGCFAGGNGEVPREAGEDGVLCASPYSSDATPSHSFVLRAG